MAVASDALDLGLQFLVRDVGRLSRRRFEQFGQELGLSLTRAQCFALVHVAREPGLSQAHLAHLMDVEPIALVRLIDRLQAENLVERRLDPNDRRVWRLYLTRTAASATERIQRISNAVTERAFVNVPQRERTALVAMLQQIKVNLTDSSPLLKREERDRRGGGSLALTGSLPEAMES
jgi:MarR family transcriptional regulator, transcriptional regulator for hemolysin